MGRRIGGIFGPISKAIVPAVLGVSLIPAWGLGKAQAAPDDIARQVTNNAIQNVIQNIRDQVQLRLKMRGGRTLRFDNENSSSGWIYDDAFGFLGPQNQVLKNALGYMPTKAAPMQQVQPAWIYGLNLTGSYDRDRAEAAGGVATVTRSYSVVGSGDITKIGIASDSDALTFIATGNGVWSHSDPTVAAGATRADTDGVSGTLVYLNAGYSMDWTTGGQWTKTTTAGVVTKSHSISETLNAQNKFDLQNSWWIEPTVGATFTQIRAATPPAVGFVNADNNTTELHGGARVGNEFDWNGAKVQPSFTALAYNMVSHTLLTPQPQAGKTGARESLKVNVQWTSNFSTYLEGHASQIHWDDAYGASGGVRWTF